MRKVPDSSDARKAISTHAFLRERRSRQWNDVWVDSETYDFAGIRGPGLHTFKYQNRARLTTLLEVVGGACEPRLAPNRPCNVAYRPRALTYVGPGLPLWGYSDRPRYARDVCLSFDRVAVERVLQSSRALRQITVPRLAFNDSRMWTLLNMLADACDNQDPSGQLYGDGLVTSILSLMLVPEPVAKTAQRPLARWQLNRVVEFINEELPNRVPLAHLAQMTGLSQAHFSRAFKLSTGVAPYRWQVEARLNRSKHLLISSNQSLESVATETGFADKAHFCRAFKRVTGIAPMQWRRQNR